jgi:hypothetical protein
MHLSVGIEAIAFPSIPRLLDYFTFNIIRNTEVLLCEIMDALMTKKDEWERI